MLKENGYQRSIISKIFKRITDNHSLPQLQQQTQAAYIQEEDIRMSINLPYIEGTSEKLRRILRSQKVTSTSTPKTLCVNSFVNLKVEQLQKIKIISIIKLTVVTAKQCTSVNLNGL